MNVLIANDDGIEAEGLRRLAKTLSSDADVYICAPESQRSASGHGITISQPIIAEEVEYENARLAFSISGTPADCVKLGIELCRKRGVEIDMVYSGINHGGNLGSDTLYSGTVSAAVEATLNGIPAVAVSVDSHDAVYFDYACELALDALRKSRDPISPHTALNINTPNLPKEEIKGVRVTTLGPREYVNEFEIPDDSDAQGRISVGYGGEPVRYNALPDTVDVAAIEQGYATITPLHGDLTDYKLVDELKKWRIGE